MLRIITAVLLLGALTTQFTFAQDSAPLLDQQVDSYRLVVTSASGILENGPQDVVLTLTDAASGAPAAASGMNIEVLPIDNEGQPTTAVAVRAGTTEAHIFRSFRLLFPEAGTWTLNVEVVTADGQRHRFSGPVTVRSISMNILNTAKIAVPATVIVLLLLVVGWRTVRKRRQAI